MAQCECLTLHLVFKKLFSEKKMFKWQQSRNSDNWCDANIVLKTKFFKYLLSEKGEKIPIESVGFQKNKNMNIQSDLLNFFTK